MVFPEMASQVVDIAIRASHCWCILREKRERQWGSPAPLSLTGQYWIVRCYEVDDALGRETKKRGRKKAVKTLHFFFRFVLLYAGSTTSASSFFWENEKAKAMSSYPPPSNQTREKSWACGLRPGPMSLTTTYVAPRTKKKKFEFPSTRSRPIVLCFGWDAKTRYGQLRKGAQKKMVMERIVPT